jgi:hypothetical protein
VAAFAGTTAAAGGPLRAKTPGILRQTVPGTDVSFQMVSIPAGSFVIGSPPDEAARQATRATMSSVSAQAANDCHRSSISSMSRSNAS